MKLHLPKRLLLAVLAACGTFVPSAYAAVSTEAKTKTDETTGATINYNVYTWTGSDSANNSMNLSNYGVNDVVIFQLTGTSNTNYFPNGTSYECTAGSVVIGDEPTEENAGTKVVTGLILTNGWTNAHQTFTGIVTGNGVIQKTGSGTNNKLTFEGDATGYTGDINLHTSGGGPNFTLTFGSRDFTEGAASSVAAAETSATAGAAGTGNVEFANASNTLRFNFAADENPVYITNLITDINTGDNANSNLVLTGGANYILTKSVTVDKITLSANSAATFNNSLTVAGDSSFGGAVTINGTAVFNGSVTLSQMWENAGSITFNGSLTLNSLDEVSYKSASSYVVTTANGAAESGNGYSVGRKYVVVDGNVTLGENFTFSGASNVQFVENVGLVATLSDALVTDTFYVNTGTVNMGADGYTDMTAATYWVKNGATLNLNGKNFADKSLVLDGGAIVTNTGTSYSDNARQMNGIALNGSAVIDLANSHGIIAYGWEASTLTLNGHTLTKKGDATFYLINTTVDAGTIRIEDGTIQIGTQHSKGKITSAESTVFDIQGGMIYLDNGRLNAAGLTGDSGSVTQSYNGESNTNSTLQLGADNSTAYEYGGTLSVTNLIKTGAGTQKITGDAAVTNLTMQRGTLEFTNLTQNIAVTHANPQDGSVAAATVKINGMSAENAQVSVSGNASSKLTLYVTGADVINIDRAGGNLYTELVINNNTSAKSTWTGTLNLSNISDNPDNVTAENRKLNFNKWVAAGGKIVLTGVGGYIDGVKENKSHAGGSSAETYVTAADLELNNSTSGQAALTVNDGSSNKYYEFSGAITGTGDMVIARDIPLHFVFSGDISGWKDGASLSVTKGGDSYFQNLYFVENATKVNLSKIETTAGDSTVTFYHTQAATVASQILKSGSGTLNLSVYNNSEAGTVFNGAVTTDKVEVIAGGKATFNGAVVTGQVNVLADAEATFNQEIKTNVIDIAAGGEVIIANHWYDDTDISTDQTYGVLRGAGNLTLKAAADASAEKLTTTMFYVEDYSGVLDFENNPFIESYVYVNGGKSLKLDGSHNNGDAYIELHLQNAASVTTDITVEGTAIGIDKLKVLGQAVFGTDASLDASNQGLAGVFDIGILHSDAEDKVEDNIIFRSNSNTSDITVFNLESLNYSGRITLESTNTEDYRYAALNIGTDDSELVYEGFWYWLSDIELLTGESETDQVALGVVGDVYVRSFLGDDTDAYIVAGRVTETLADGETFKSTTEDFKNVYVYGLEGETPAVSSATIMSNINLTKLETPGSQIFNGDTTAFNGTVDVFGGTLGFGTSSLSTKDTTVHDGKLQYADGAVTMTRLGEKDVVYAEITEASFSKAEDGTVCIDGGTMKNTLLSIKEATSLELGSVHMYDNSQVAGHSADSHNKVTLNHTTLVMENLGEGTHETLPSTMSAEGMLELGLMAGAEGISYTTDMFKDVDLTGTGYVAIGTLLADALLQHDYVALEFNQSYLDQDLQLITGVDIDPRLEGVIITTFIDTEAGRLYMSVPEPSTATLSLLALAALAARRRRK